MTEQPAPAFDFPRATKAAILEADDQVRELVQIPEWRMSVWVRSMTGIERDRFESSVAQVRIDDRGKTRIESKRDNVRALICSMTMVDDEGANLFTPADVLILGQKNASALNRVFTVAQRLSGLTDEDVVELKEPLGTDRSDASGSDSPATSA